MIKVKVKIYISKMKGKKNFLSSNTHVADLLPIQCTTYMLHVH